MLKRLAIKTIRLDFQRPENLLEETVTEYVYRLRRRESLLPIRVRFDGTNYFLEDGFHRLEAARRIGRKQIKARILLGTLAQMEVRWNKALDRLKADLAKEAKAVRKKAPRAAKDAAV